MRISSNPPRPSERIPFSAPRISVPKSRQGPLARLHLEAQPRQGYSTVATVLNDAAGDASDETP